MTELDTMRQEIMALRADPRTARIYDYLSPDAKAMFESLGEQNADVNQASGGWKNPMSKIPFLHPTEDYAPTETNIFGDVFDRPRAAVAATLSNIARPITRDPYMSPVEAFQKPRQVPDIGASQERHYTEWARQNLPMPLAVAGDVIRQPIGWASTIFSNPGNFLPMGAVGRFGGNVVSKIPGAQQAAGAVSKWAGTHLPTFGGPVQEIARNIQSPKPVFTPRVAPKAGALPEDKAIDPRAAQRQAEWDRFVAEQKAKQALSGDVPPQQAPIDMPDDAAAYEAWLEQHLPKIPANQRPPAEVPLHPIEDAIPMADAFNLKQNVTVDPSGQMVMKGGMGGELGPQIFKPGKPGKVVPQPKGQMEFPFARAPEQAPIDFSPFELPPQGPAPKAPKKWAKAAPGEQMSLPGGEGGRMGPEIFGKKAPVTIEVPIDKAAAEAKIAALRAKKQGAKPAPAPVVNPQPPVQVMKLLRGDQPGTLEQLVQNFAKLPNPKNPAEMLERMAMRKDLAARAKERGQELKLNKQGVWELQNPEAQPKMPAKKGRAIQPAQAKPMPAEKLSPLEAGILARAQQKVSPLEQGIQPRIAKAAPKKVTEPAKPVKHLAPISEREARKLSFRAEIERRRQALFGEMKQAKGREAVKQGLEELAPAVEGKGIKSAADKRIDELLARMPDEPVATPDTSGKFIKGEKYSIPDQVNAELLEYQGFDPMNKQHVFKAADGEIITHDLDSVIVDKLAPRKTTMGEAVKKSKKGLGNKGQAVAPIPEPEDVLKAAGEGAKKEVLRRLDISGLPEHIKVQLRSLYEGQKKDVPPKELLGNLNISKFKPEQQAQIKELFKGQEDKLKTTPISNKETRARAKDMEYRPIARQILKKPEGQLAAEATSMIDEETTRLVALANDPKVAAIDKVKAVNQLALQDIRRVASEMGRGLQALKMEPEVNETQMAGLRAIMDQLRADPTLSKQATKAAIKALTDKFPDLNDQVSLPSIYKSLFRNSIMSGWKTITSNAVSNKFKLFTLPANKAIEVTARKLVSMMNGTPTNATYKEVGAVLRGVSDALHGVKLDPKLFASIRSEKYGRSPWAQLADTAATAKEEKDWRIVDKVLTYPERFMKLSDVYTKNMRGLAEQYAALARGEKLTDFRTREGIKEAQLKVTFQDAMSRVGTIINNMRNSARGLGAKKGKALSEAIDMFLFSLQPFVHTVDRIIGGGLKLSPAGWFNPVLQTMVGRYKGAFAKGAAHDAKAAKALAEDVEYIIAGLPVVMATVHQYQNGNIVGALSSDPKTKEAQKDAGMIPYSFRLGGKYHPMRLLPEPMASGAQFTVAILDGVREGTEKGQTAAMKLWSSALHFGGVVIGKPYLGGLNSVLSSFSEFEAGKDEPKTLGEMAVTRKLGSAAVASVIKDIGEARAYFSGTSRKMSDNIGQDLRRRAGATSGMVDELNAFGEPMTYDRVGVDLSAKDPKYQLLKDVPPPTLDRRMMGFELTQQEYHDAKKAIGARYNQIYSQYSKLPGFMKMRQGMKAHMLEPKLQEAREQGLKLLRMKLKIRDPLYANEKMRRLFELKRPKHRPDQKESTWPFPTNK